MKSQLFGQDVWPHHVMWMVYSLLLTIWWFSNINLEGFTDVMQNIYSWWLLEWFICSSRFTGLSHCSILPLYHFICGFSESFDVKLFSQNPSIADVYTEHSQPTTVAKYSPSGFYIASAGQLKDSSYNCFYEP